MSNGCFRKDCPMLVNGKCTDQSSTVHMSTGDWCCPYHEMALPLSEFGQRDREQERGEDELEYSPYEWDIIKEWMGATRHASGRR